MLEVCFIPRDHVLLPDVISIPRTNQIPVHSIPPLLSDPINPECISCYGCDWSYTSRLLSVDIQTASTLSWEWSECRGKISSFGQDYKKKVFCPGCGAKVKVRDSLEYLMIIRWREEKAWSRSEPTGDQSQNISRCLWSLRFESLMSARPRKLQQTMDVRKWRRQQVYRNYTKNLK